MVRHAISSRSARINAPLVAEYDDFWDGCVDLGGANAPPLFALGASLPLFLTREQMLPLFF